MRETTMGPSNYINPDPEVEKWDRVRLEQEVMKLRSAIRYHRDQKGDDRCWLDDIKLYEALPETGNAELTLPPKEEFLGSCKKFWECRQGQVFKNADHCYDSGSYRSINVPEQ